MQLPFPVASIYYVVGCLPVGPPCMIEQPFGVGGDVPRARPTVHVPAHKFAGHVSFMYTF